MSVSAIATYPEKRSGARTLRAVNVVSHVDLRAGGICSTMPAFSRALSATGHWTTTTVAIAPEDEISPFGPADGPLLRLPSGRKRWLTDRSLKRQVHEQIQSADIVHIHGIWDEHCNIACGVARSLGKPYIISAHGMLDPWAVRNKRLKKLVYAALIERRNLNVAACLRSVTAAETGDYQRFGIEGLPVAVLPLGVEAPPSANRADFFEKYPELREKRLVLFLGRLHYKKGLDLLCRAWAQIREQFPNAHLILAGPETAETHASLMKLIGELGIASSITFTGMLEGDLKWSAIAASTLFVLPSYSENFAVAVSEAMALTRPVIVTRQCNRPEVAEARAGWVIEPDAGQLTEALQNALSMSGPELDSYGANGRRLIQERYSWPAIGRDTAAVYEWILGLGPKPACVRDAP